MPSPSWPCATSSGASTASAASPSSCRPTTWTTSRRCAGGSSSSATARCCRDGTLEALRARVSRERWLTVDLERDADISDPDATLVRRAGGRVCLAFDPERVATATLIARITAAHPVRDLFVENPPIESIVAQLYASR